MRDRKWSISPCIVPSWLGLALGGIRRNSNGQKQARARRSWEVLTCAPLLEALGAYLSSGMDSVLNSERRESDEAGGRRMGVPALDLARTVFIASASFICVHRGS